MEYLNWITENRGFIFLIVLVVSISYAASRIGKWPE